MKVIITTAGCAVDGSIDGVPLKDGDFQITEILIEPMKTRVVIEQSCTKHVKEMMIPGCGNVPKVRNELKIAAMNLIFETGQ